MITLLKSKLTNEVLVEVDKKWLGIKDGREVYAYSPDTWDKIEIEFETLSKRSAQIGDLKNKLIKAQQEVIELTRELKKVLELVRKAGFIIQGKGNPAEHYLTEANNILITL
jgi:3-hydroxyacyl-CoA dehydrogenase